MWGGGSGVEFKYCSFGNVVVHKCLVAFCFVPFTTECSKNPAILIRLVYSEY